MYEEKLSFEHVTCITSRLNEIEGPATWLSELYEIVSEKYVIRQA
jgi:hypothetical protein